MKPASVDSMIQALQLFWQNREPRERALISIATAVLVLGGLYGWVIDPALSATQRLKTELPAAQAKLAQVQALAVRAKSSVSTRSNSPTQANLQASLSAATINATVSAAAPWVITINSASGEALWAWLATHDASKSTLKRGANGAWSGELTLE